MLPLSCQVAENSESTIGNSPPSTPSHPSLRLIESGLSQDLSPFGPPSEVSRAALPGRLGPGDTFELPNQRLRYRAGVGVRPASFPNILRILRGT